MNNDLGSFVRKYSFFIILVVSLYLLGPSFIGFNLFSLFIVGFFLVLWAITFDKLPVRPILDWLNKSVLDLVFRKDHMSNIAPPVEPTEDASGTYKFSQKGKRTKFLGPILFTLFCFVWAGIALGQTFLFGDKSTVNIVAGICAVLVGFIGIFVTIRRALLLKGSNKEEVTLDEWPLKLGQKVNVTYRRDYYDQIELSGISIHLVCNAEIPVDDDTNGTFTLCDEELLSESLSMKEGTITEDMSFRTPLNGCPSFYRTVHKYEWILLVSLKTDPGYAANLPYENTEYKLQVIPELITEGHSGE